MATKSLLYWHLDPLGKGLCVWVQSCGGLRIQGFRGLRVKCLGSRMFCRWAPLSPPVSVVCRWFGFRGCFEVYLEGTKS